MAKPNKMYQAIKKLLEDNPEGLSQMTIIEKLPQFKPGSISSCIRQARGLRDGYEHIKTMYVKEYDHHYGQAGQPSPVMMLGNAPCAPMPPINPETGKKGRWTRYNAKVSKRRAAARAAKNAANTVFQNMANPPRIRQDRKDLKALTVIRHELVDDEALV